MENKKVEKNYQKCQNFQVWGIRLFEELQYAQNETNCNSVAYTKLKIGPFMKFNFFFFSIRSFGKFQYAQNDTNNSSLRCS
jgi:hypothetical protein